MLTAIMSNLSLAKWDKSWREIAESSCACRLMSAINQLSATGSLAKLGKWIQQLSFIVVALLFVVLTMPRFAGDKEGLAVVACLGLVLWLIGYFLGGSRRLSSSLDIPVWFYLAANIVACASSHYLPESLHGLLKIAIYVGSYFLFTATLQNSSRKCLILTIVLIATAVANSLYGFYQYKIGVAPLATWEDPTLSTQGTRIFGTLGNPNLLAGFLVPIMPLALATIFLFYAQKRYLLATISGASALVIAVAIILTGSRGGYIGLFTGVAAIIIIGSMALFQGSKINIDKRSIMLIIAAAVILCAALFALHCLPTFEQRLLSIFAGREHSSNSFRLNVWHASWKMFLDNWWLGVGTGNLAFRRAYGLYMVSGFDALGTYCVPLEVAVELGVFGLCTFAFLVVASLARAHLTFWNQQAPTINRWLAAGAAAALIGMLAHGLVDTVFYRPQVQFIFWLLISIIVSTRDNILERKL